MNGQVFLLVGYFTFLLFSEFLDVMALELFGNVCSRVEPSFHFHLPYNTLMNIRSYICCRPAGVKLMVKFNYVDDKLLSLYT